MKRISQLLSLTLLLFPAVAAAQSAASTSKWTLTLQGGIHLDRFDRPERMNQQAMGGSDYIYAFTSRGEAPTVGLRVTRWLGGHLGVDGGLALAHNASWSGGLLEGESGPRKLTLFGSVAPVWRVLAPSSTFQLQLGAGPAFVGHMGTGESLLTRSTDLGGMAMADASLRLSRRLRLVVDAQNYRFRSSFDRAVLPFGATQPYPAGSVTRSEWVFQSGLRVSF